MVRKKNGMRPIWFYMPEDELKEIARQVKKGRFINRSECIRFCVRSVLERIRQRGGDDDDVRTRNKKE
ncbi:MAG: ribbon-helix-helix domain-containing protein [Methanophagales archaeon]|nr:ribbon-helix-helix domain-containing protein [Methanophagales archaeon]